MERRVVLVRVPLLACARSIRTVIPMAKSTLPLPTLRTDTLDRLRLLIVAGITTGVLVVGVGSRLAMFALRLTSPEHVRGITSDDGFVIGRFTLSGTYNLLALGAAGRDRAG